MGDRQAQAVRDLIADHTFAWRGTRLCDLGTRNVDLIKAEVADGTELTDYVAITAFLVEKTGGRIIQEAELVVERPMNKRLATCRVELWFCATLEARAKEEEQQTRYIEVQVKTE